MAGAAAVRLLSADPHRRAFAVLSEPLAVAMMDLDKFKRVNDERGHADGDALLVTLAKVIQDSARDTDVVARFGGDEFLVLYPRTSLEDARTGAARVVAAVQQAGSEFDPSRPVTVSVGLACARPLNALALGEAQAALLGVNVERIKRRVIVVTALAVGAVTATTGIIGFIGLIAPHWVRMVAGPDHRVVLPASALLGAALVLAADGVARTVMAPAELPLGVLTAVIGVPMFLAMLRHFRGRF